jgi:hypothetical protein
LRCADQASYLRAKEFSDKAGIPLELMASRYYRLLQILGETPPDVAAEYYQKVHPTELPIKSVKVVIDEIEIQRLVWEDIRLEDGYIEIRARNAKTASRRMIAVVPTLKEWLLKYARFN